MIVWLLKDDSATYIFSTEEKALEYKKIRFQDDKWIQIYSRGLDPDPVRDRQIYEEDIAQWQAERDKREIERFIISHPELQVIPREDPDSGTRYGF